MATSRNLDIASRFKDSGISLRDFAVREGISIATLSYHLKRASRTSPGQEGFARLEVAVPQDRIVITTSGGTTIEIPL